MSFAHLTIATAEVDRTAEFFLDVMSWEDIPVPASTEICVRWLDIGDGGQVHILEVPKFHASEFEAEYGRHFAFFATAPELAHTKQRLRDRGLEIIKPIRPTPFERIFFKDPNGYMIEVINRDEWVVEG